MLNRQQMLKARSSLRPRTNLAAAKLFTALGNCRRCHIFQLLIQHRGLCVSDIAHILQITPAAASQHLQILFRAGLVQREQNGRAACYRIRKEPAVRAVAKLILANS